MDVQGAYQYLETHGVVGTPVDTTQLAHIHVDVLSIYFAYLVGTMKSLLDRAFKAENPSQPGVLTTAQMKITLVPRLASALSNRLENHFHRTRATLHIDGTPTLEKTQAHTARSNIYQTNHAKTVVAITNVLNIINPPPPAPPPPPPPPPPLPAVPAVPAVPAGSV